MHCTRYKTSTRREVFHCRQKVLSHFNNAVRHCAGVLQDEPLNGLTFTFPIFFPCVTSQQGYSTSRSTEQDLRGMGPGLVDGFDVIRTLSFPYCSRFPWRNPNITSHMDIGFMRKCKILKMVTLYFVEREILEQVPHPKPASTLRRQYHLDEMLQLSSLETLRIVVPIHLDYWEYDGVHELAAWFKDEFAKLGRKVDAVAGAWEIPKAE